MTTGLGNALINFIDHNLNDVKRKSHMKFGGNGAWVVQLQYHYIVGNTKNATACYIGAHGGSSGSQYGIDNKSFIVPDGCHVKFYQPHGYCFALNNNFLRSGAPLKQDDSEGDVEFAAGETCTNYLLSKFEGRHGSDSMKDAEQQGTTYQALQSIAEEAGIVMVTIRNRWSAANVSLLDTIKAVREVAPSITTFHCLFCRVDDSDSDWTWSASSGTWRP